MFLSSLGASRLRPSGPSCSQTFKGPLKQTWQTQRSYGTMLGLFALQLETTPPFSFNALFILIWHLICYQNERVQISLWFWSNCSLSSMSYLFVNFVIFCKKTREGRSADTAKHWCINWFQEPVVYFCGKRELRSSHLRGIIPLRLIYTRWQGIFLVTVNVSHFLLFIYSKCSITIHTNRLDP